MRKFFKHQRGDTIMEVLIAVAVLSLVLTISFALTNRSSQGNRQAQERGEASKIAESQIELLKEYISQTPMMNQGTPPNLPPSGSKFCMKSDGTPTAAITGAIPADAQQDNFSAFNEPALADCKKNETYFSYIERNNDTFTAHTRWYKVTGTGIDEASVVHRIYPDLASRNPGGGTIDTGCPVNHFMNSLGGCTICPVGHSSIGGTSTSCAPVPPSVLVNVRKVRPLPGDLTPPCSSTDTEPKSGISVNLTIPTSSHSGTTDNLSNALIGGLEQHTMYTATVTAPNRYEVCAPTSQTIRTQGTGSAVGVGSQAGPLFFKVIPKCDPAQEWGWRNYPYNHDHYEYELTGTWVGHPGPDWGPNGSPETNPRYAIGDDKYGYPQTHTEGAYPNRVIYELHHVGSRGGWYNRFQEHGIYNWVYKGTHVHDNWQFVVVRNFMDCPS